MSGIRSSTCLAKTCATIRRCCRSISVRSRSNSYRTCACTTAPSGAGIGR